MATSKSFFGKRRGSTKNFTFAVFNGKQVTKEKAEQVKNPRTLAQMRNRMILTTSSAAYAAMKEIVDHSFQGFVYGLQNMSRFQSVNNKLLRANLQAATSQFAYANYGDARVLPGAYVIAEGSLAPIPSAMFACAITGANSVAFTIQPGVTAEQLTADAIIAALGLQVGELATLCFLADCGTEAGYKFGFIRLTVKAAGDVQLTAQNLTDYFTIESNAPVAITSVADGTAVITATIDGVQAAGGLCYGCIHSAQENGAWKRSDAKFTIADGTTLEPSATQAIATYPVGGSKILNDGDIPGGYTAEGGEPTPTPPAVEGDVQIFADAECSQYATGNVTKVYARVNNAVGFGEGFDINLGSGHGGKLSVNTPKQGTPDDPYSITAYEVFIGDGPTTGFAAGSVIELESPLETNVTDYVKVFTKS